MLDRFKELLDGSNKVILCPFCLGEFRLKDGIQGGRVKCPLTDCGKFLPNNVVDYRKGLDSARISIIGARRAGKSHFIAMLVHLIRESHAEFGWTLRPLDDATIERYGRDFHGPVFRDGVLIEQTMRPTLVDSRASEPLSYILTITGKTGRKSLYLSFYDAAGESFNSEDLISRESKYIYKSDAIIVLLDPLQIPAVRKELHNKVRLDKEETSTSDIVSRTANLIRRSRNIHQGKQLKIPVAVAFSKIDVVRPLFPAGSALHYESNHKGAFSRSEFQAVDSDMRAMLLHWGSGGLIGQLEGDFPKNGFFGLSALGSNPGTDQKIPKLEPYRVLDPFLWQLHNLGLIASKE